MNYSGKYIYIIGAGFAGQMIAAEISRKKIFGKTAAFIDDDPDLIGKTVDNIPVLAPTDHFIPLLRHTDRDEAIIAMPSASKERIKEIFGVDDSKVELVKFYKPGGAVFISKAYRR